MVVGDTSLKKIIGINLSKDLIAGCMMLMVLCVLAWRYSRPQPLVEGRQFLESVLAFCLAFEAASFLFLLLCRVLQASWP